MAQASSMHLRTEDVRNLRKSRGWSAQRLAEECAKLGEPSLSRGTIAKIESGVRKSVTDHELAVLAAALGVTSSDLVDDTSAGPVVQAASISGDVIFSDGRSRTTPLPLRLGLVPPRAAAYQDRVETNLGSIGHEKAVVLFGMGGVGKTQLAAAYAEKAWAAGRAGLLVWITATSREAIVSSYARMADLLTGEEFDPEHGAQRALEWLATTTEPWLVVLDDLQSPGDLQGLWPPSTPAGQTLVTTRRRDAALHGDKRQVVGIDVFSSDEATAYLHAVLGGHPRLLDGAAELVQDLGRLPLALAQAGAYMLDRQLSCAEYRARLASRHLASMVPHSDALPDTYRSTVAATLALSVEQADRWAPEGVARPLLDAASALDANGIPIEVLTAPSVLNLLSEGAGRPIDEYDARDGLGCLHRLSLISLDVNSRSREVRIHPLVQRITRDSWSDERTEVVVHAVADAVLHAWPDVEQDRAVAQALRDNAAALVVTGGRHLWRQDGHQVLFRLGESLGEGGLPAEARDYYDGLRRSAAHDLEPDHSSALAVRASLARWRGEAGDPVGAAAEFERLLADQVRVFGPDHVDTRTTRAMLAHWRGETEDSSRSGAPLEESTHERW
ncbi:helix-turn-helix domain-containing protein [Lentzea kentuckyensis]|uniref:helix-turn-helix domain-containing protein n=1 Tax=Lentzea kentuckyensis TaxID=360086 RepID=UPI0013023735|nr:helix-turn-helix domain-containing protein [Lentzea kentuckyensis]